jgi:hypothetical protein
LFGAKAAPSEAAPANAVVRVVDAEVAAVHSLDSTPYRVWIDNTGRYSTEGRLIKITKDYVRLLKRNGRTCTVPHERLGDADAAYVEAIAEELAKSRLALLSQN